MKLACPNCGIVHEASLLAPGSIITCKCGQPFKIPAYDGFPAPKTMTPFIRQPQGFAETAIKKSPIPPISIAALICGVMAFTMCPLITAFPAVFLGIMGLKEASKSQEKSSGKTFALIGLLLGVLNILIAVAAIASILLLPELLGGVSAPTSTNL